MVDDSYGDPKRDAGVLGHGGGYFGQAEPKTDRYHQEPTAGWRTPLSLFTIGARPADSAIRPSRPVPLPGPARPPIHVTPMKLLHATHIAALALASTQLTSCVSGRRPIVLGSSPPGALVIVDGVDSGHSTPCTIQLPDKSRTFEFQLAGYETEKRDIRIGERSRVVYWSDAATDYRTWTFPFWLSAQDFFAPVKEDDGEMPSRIHVRLRRARQPIAQAR